MKTNLLNFNPNINTFTRKKTADHACFQATTDTIKINDSPKYKSIYSSKGVIFFGKKIVRNKKVIEIMKDYHNKGEISPESRIPDGFRYASAHDMVEQEMIDDNGEFKDKKFSEGQITVVDRKKDKDLKDIIKNYKKDIAKWKKEFSLSNKKKWDNFLVEKTKEFLEYYKDDDYDDPTDMEKHDFANKESYLGEIIKNKKGVCRHFSILAKILLDDQKVNIGVQQGMVASYDDDFSKMFGGHVWNFREENPQNNEKFRQLLDFYAYIQDIYIDNDFNFLYRDGIDIKEYEKINPKTKIQQTIDNIQPGDRVKIKLNQKSGATRLFELEWFAGGRLLLTQIDKNKDGKVQPEKNFPINDTFEIKTNNNQYIIDPMFIILNFERRKQRAEFGLLKKDPEIKYYQQEDLTKIDKSLDTSSLYLYNEFKKTRWNTLSDQLYED